MTKKEARIRKAEWQTALMEGRVVKYGDKFRSFPTREAAERFRDALLAHPESDATVVKWQPS